MRAKEAIQIIQFGSTHKNQRGRSVAWISKLCSRTSFICTYMNKNFYFKWLVLCLLTAHSVCPLTCVVLLGDGTTFPAKLLDTSRKLILKYETDNVKVGRICIFYWSKVKDTISSLGNSTVGFFSFSFYIVVVYWFAFITMWLCFV